MGTGLLNIAMLSVHSCPVGRLGSKDTGGMSVYIRELARELGRRGHHVDIYTRAHDPAEARTVHLSDNVRIIHLQAGEVEPVDKLVVYSHLETFASSLEDFRERNGLRYDVIHSHYWLSGWVGRKIQRRWNVPHVIMFHTLGAIKNAIGVGDTEPALRIMAERELALDCQRIIAATEREKQDLGRYYDAPPDKISVIPCGVNLDLFRRIDKEAARQRLGFNGNRIILFVGRIEPLKGLDKLLTALSALGSGQSRLVGMLVVVGGDERSQAEVARLRKLSRSLHIEDIVTFRGIEEQEMLPLYYSAADVCVIPSYYESFGLVALESLACGTPIVATRVGCIDSVIRQGHNGCMVEDNAPARLAHSIAALLTEQDNGLKSADSIRASVNGYSWSDIAEAIIPVYKEAISGQHSAIRRAH